MNEPTTEEIIEALEDVVQQACLCGCPEPPVAHVDSLATSAYADAIRMLVKLGRLTVLKARGRRVVAKWVPREAPPASEK